MLLNTNSGPLYYEVAGAGQAIVFVSGWAMSCECWRPAIRMLKRNYLCVSFDARGVGRSQPCSSDARFTIEDHAEDLHAILEETRIFDATIVGHEIGSLIAAAAIDRHPQDAQALMVVSPRPAISQDDVRSLAVFTPASLALRELAAYPVLRNVVARRFRRAPQPHRDRLFADFAELSPRAAYETALSASGAEEAALLDSLVMETTSPVLLLCGEKDKKGASEARRLFSLARTAKLATIRDCGFMPMLEYPQQFVRLVRDFVSRNEKARSHAILKR